jgi:hypothetical protein
MLNNSKIYFLEAKCAYNRPKISLNIGRPIMDDLHDVNETIYGRDCILLNYELKNGIYVT